MAKEKRIRNGSSDDTSPKIVNCNPITQLRKPNDSKLEDVVKGGTRKEDNKKNDQKTNNLKTDNNENTSKKKKKKKAINIGVNQIISIVRSSDEEANLSEKVDELFNDINFKMKVKQLTIDIDYESSLKAMIPFDEMESKTSVLPSVLHDCVVTVPHTATMSLSCIKNVDKRIRNRQTRKRRVRQQQPSNTQKNDTTTNGNATIKAIETKT